MTRTSRKVNQLGATTNADVWAALDAITGGRVIRDLADLRGNHPFVFEVSSGIPGKSIMELPGLIFGDASRPVRKLAVMMTLTESALELAAASGIDAIIAHHPVADAASSGGVPLATYLSLYNISLFELHDAFHGLHPGIAFLHGHVPYHVDGNWGHPHNLLMLGNVLPEICRVGDIVERLTRMLGQDTDRELLEAERRIRGCADIEESVISAHPRLRLGDPDARVERVLHFMPHSGFTRAEFELAIEKYPEIDAVIVSITRFGPDYELLGAIEKTGKPLIFGNSHNLEIFENGLPLGHALQELLPNVDVCILRERTTSTPLKSFGGAEIQTYAADIAAKHLLNRDASPRQNHEGNVRT